MEIKKLYNGNSIPNLGLGTFLMIENAESCVFHALTVGYRLIDTASVYENEEDVGKAINKAINEKVVRRDEIFVSSKLQAIKTGKREVLKGYQETLDKMKLDYLDQYMIHWVPRDYDVLLDTWHGFEELYLSKKAKNIGICNISLYYLDKLIHDAKIKPMTVQVELHPFFQQQLLREYCEKRDIVVMGYGSFAKGKVFNNEKLNQIANNHHCSIAQIVIKWGLENNLVMIPKSSHLDRIDSNMNLNFDLNENEKNTIKELNDGLRLYRDPDNNPYVIK